MKKSDDGHVVRVSTTPSIVRISFANCGKRKSKRREQETVTGEQEAAVTAQLHNQRRQVAL